MLSPSRLNACGILQELSVVETSWAWFLVSEKANSLPGALRCCCQCKPEKTMARSVRTPAMLILTGLLKECHRSKNLDLACGGAGSLREERRVPVVKR